MLQIFCFLNYGFPNIVLCMLSVLYVVGVGTVCLLVEIYQITCRIKWARFTSFVFCLKTYEEGASRFFGIYQTMC
jgi:hypothetical protein